jgi:hypothetical protein
MSTDLNVFCQRLSDVQTSFLKTREGLRLLRLLGAETNTLSNTLNILKVKNLRERTMRETKKVTPIYNRLSNKTDV